MAASNTVGTLTWVRQTRGCCAPAIASRCSARPASTGWSPRTYVWGAALAARDGLDFDREAAYVVSVVHDLYSDDPAALPGPPCALR
jgi:hypothetical protein